MLRDMVPLGCSKARLARALGLSRYQLSEILAEKRPVTKASALRLETVVGGSAQSWTDMQAAYDAWPVRRDQ
jgi:addiction module HigA family antidote